MSYIEDQREVEGTVLFDHRMAKKGYGLNKMCFSFNDQVGRDEFSKDEAGYCDKFGLTEIQKKAVLDKDILTLLKEGGSIYYLAKFAGLLKLNMQDIGALQTGMSVEEFKAMLVKNGQGK
ncbi:protocatechuate 4,5-dioxygenase subunit alpha [Marinomonas mediterranea]|jgi:protocatechuate 4,5-dioxygenase alpha subunit (EC 1.13.11.8)|uniref:Extradiol ring-cleavage dioxygenase LigAB LigA subunit n=1 Tax=Marinomonas mediterranea (strain ATCC 700492 / JCM 21426 / NBRC 103028 / MMB-1) TaxID=717774 RepID=F2K360_MARM1|nr:protocatechuate 4,5-dioxygenase subunit alpha [Marinomonas mediterranea]ADZ90113.1 Extradiol ring-cleavage dioxygenase LigAB LigA subunit [Marinomonas mediterranea MMB-1]WCN08179.1 protocatechuate 4,5-dioxygenase subunit alpha [Marinomonas mediterranea]WCN12246.1 protocatechuate 4,5-dioxygenase subunit alpha [Marinomonas mediterranea]WCN16319.1 protocatechuate 4,5-dioxygenase subunit alpha [Marinomonas mediterranea MMB-1]